MKKFLILMLVLGGLILIFFFFIYSKSNQDSNKGLYTVNQYSAPWDKNLFDNFYVTAKENRTIGDIGKVKGGIIPHHLLAGEIDASFFNYLAKQKPSTIVLISPNHFWRGRSNIITSALDWKTPYGTVASANDIITQLSKAGVLAIDEEAIKEEHGLYSIIPFIAKSIPSAKVIPIMIKDKTTSSTLDKLITEIYAQVSTDTVYVASVDFSHEMTVEEAKANDAICRQAIKDFDYRKILELKIDSPESLYVLLKLLEKSEAKKIGYEVSGNSSQYLHSPDPKDTTSYYSAYFVAEKWLYLIDK